MINSTGTRMMINQNRPNCDWDFIAIGDTIISAHNSHVNNTNGRIALQGQQIAGQKEKLAGLEGTLEGIDKQLKVTYQTGKEEEEAAKKLQKKIEKTIEEASEMLKALEIESNKQISMLESEVLRLTERGKERDEQFERIISMVEELEEFQKTSFYAGSTRAPSVASEYQEDKD